MDISQIKGINSDLLRRYVNMREKLDKEADGIYCVTSLLTHLKSCGDDGMVIDPVAIGDINQILNTHVLKIWEILDDFIYIVEARMVLERLEQTSDS